MRIALVNDLNLALTALRRVVASVPGYSVAWEAKDGAEAVRLCKEDTPDLVLMDLIMPIMDGVAATREIMRACPCPILVVTATVDGNADKVFEAMGQGALDAVCTPSLGPGGEVSGGEELLAKVRTLGKLMGNSLKGGTSGVASFRTDTPDSPRLIALGASTGGPRALSRVLSGLPGDLGAAVVVVQHVDVQFAGSLADWLGDNSSLPVSVIREGEAPEKNRVQLAGTNDHLVIGPDRRFHYTDEPRDFPYRPSVDRFFMSLEENYPRSGAAVVLTGMGRDGAQGLLALRRAGWRTLAQDKESSVVYGMPRAAAELDAAEEILPVDDLAAALIRAVAQMAGK